MTRFSKYHGSGNDFILIDDRSLEFPCPDKTLIKQLCHRKFGIGGDGLILLQLSSSADFKMRIFNSDGSEAEMCGNGLRCLVAFLHDLALMYEQCYVESMFGIHLCTFEDHVISIDLGKPKVSKIYNALKIHNRKINLHYLNTGVPQGVVFVKNLSQNGLMYLGKGIRHHSAFAPAGLNVNFAKIISPTEVGIRTFERGVESETMACGTGAAASALAARQRFGMTGTIKVSFLHAQPLTVQFHEQDSQIENIRMTGSAKKVFCGQIQLKRLPV